MVGVSGEELTWVEECNGEEWYTPINVTSNSKRKYTHKAKKVEFAGWGSKPLIEFLESIGEDTGKKISQYDAASIITKYINDKKLLHPQKKKRVVCDEWLFNLFGRKTISRIKVYELLEPHFAENQLGSEDDFFFSSEDEDNVGGRKMNPASACKPPTKKRVVQTPKDGFAAIIPENIKRVYLKRSLVEEELLKDSMTFEDKVVGSFVRIKSDPNDYFQKNRYMLVQVKGVRNASGANDPSREILLEVSNFIKDVGISMLSDDNFLEEECEDLCQRIRDGLLKKPTIVELDKKARALHEDVIQHWLEREVVLLQKLIDRANEKGWRRELYEYLEKKKLLETPEERLRLMHEIPEVVEEEKVVDATPHDFPDDIKQGNDGSLKSTSSVASGIPVCDRAVNGASSNQISFSSTPAARQAAMFMSKPKSGTDDWQDNLLAQKRQSADCQDDDILELQKQPADHLHDLLEQKRQSADHSRDEQKRQLADHLDDHSEQKKQPIDFHLERNGETQPVKANNHLPAVTSVEVIDLSDDDENEDSNGGLQIFEYGPESCIWHYRDPQGIIQGPFPILSLKRWLDDKYFPPDFKVWRIGQSQKEAVLLSNIVSQLFSQL